MQMFLISDNVDTIAGMQMAGVEGVLAHTEEELRNALLKAEDNAAIGLVLVTSKLCSEYRGLIFDKKMHNKKPLILEMPDRHF